jgi:hypothetical protein
MTMLDKFEANAGLTFPEDDPRVQAGVHQDDLHRSNNPTKEKK